MYFPNQRQAPETAAAMVADEFAARSIVRILDDGADTIKQSLEVTSSEIEGIKNPSRKL